MIDCPREVASVWCKGALSFRIKGPIKPPRRVIYFTAYQSPERLSFALGGTLTLKNQAALLSPGHRDATIK